jgi:uncharacterized protein
MHYAHLKFNKGKYMFPNSDFHNDLFDEFKKRGIPFDEDIRKRITDKITAVLSYVPKIGIFGKTGVGKSSLCNSIFGKEISKINDIEPCTREGQIVPIRLGTTKLNLIDLPGVGEDKNTNEEYKKLYQELLPTIDIVLWVLKADDRAYSVDQEFYENVVKPHLDQEKPFFIVINQVDKIEPFRDWDYDNHKPSYKQNENIQLKKFAVANFFNIPQSKIIAVSANEQYNLVDLINEIVYLLPKDKKITFLRNVKEDFRSEESIGATKKGFIETISEFLQGIISPVIDIADKIVNIVSKIIPWFV